MLPSGPVAQLVEHSPEERGVTSSILVWATNRFRYITRQLIYTEEVLQLFRIYA